MTDAANPFAQTPLTPEPIIAQVRRQLLTEADESRQANATVVDGLVDRVVRELWTGRVKTFVPILALRESRDLLRTERLSVTAIPPAEAWDGDAIAARQEPAAGQRRRDHMDAGRDAVRHYGRDVLGVEDDRMTL